MKTIIFASNNQHKVDEIKSLIEDQFEVLSLKEAGINIDIPEPFLTLEENAKEKSSVILKLTGKNVFSEDTGLEVEALNNEPGVRSARYAGEQTEDRANIDKLLLNLRDVENRKAQFRTVISLIIDEVEYSFEGVCKGEITLSQAGKKGFGYDSIFIPDGATKTFAEMDMKEKNQFSHRQKATAQLLAFLSQYGTKSST